MDRERCRHERDAPTDAIRRLPDSQAGLTRHRCVVCAYALGYSEDRQAEPAVQERCGHGHEALGTQTAWGPVGITPFGNGRLPTREGQSLHCGRRTPYRRGSVEFSTGPD